jgi:periplasmic divalent cation tolerance protein
MAAAKFLIVLVTCASTSEARQIAKTVVEKRLAACVNIGPPLESIYWWKERVERARERLLIMKTETRRVKALQKEISDLHSYDVPEFLLFKIEGGSKDYLRWLGEALGEKGSV